MFLYSRGRGGGAPGGEGGGVQEPSRLTHMGRKHDMPGSRSSLP